MSYAIKFIANTILLINLQNVAENLNKKVPVYPPQLYKKPE